MRFHKFFYEQESPCDDTQPWDNPRFVLAEDGVDEAVGLVARNSPGAFSLDELKASFGSDLMERLCRIGVFTLAQGRLKLDCPVFLDEDYPILQRLSTQAAEQAVAALETRRDQLVQIVSQMKNGFAPNVNLYHLLCGCILDGRYFDFLAEQDLVTASKQHPTGGDYLIILYEDTERLNRWSQRLLCSYNRYGNQTGTFVSFGDADGARRDFYRAARQRELGEPGGRVLGSVSKNELVSGFLDLLQGKAVAAELLHLYETFAYARNGEILVPVYDWRRDEAVLKELEDLVVPATAPAVRQGLSLLHSAVSLTANRHGVPVGDTANEGYHLIFGQMNEALVTAQLVAAPEFYPGEGRYRKAFELHG